MNKLKFCILGLGFISDKHIKAIEDVGGEILMACDIDETKFHKLPANVKTFTDYEKMYQNKDFKDIDYISICSPTDFHFIQSLTALKMGKKVIVEKPVCLTLSELEKLKPYQDNLAIMLQLRYDKNLQKPFLFSTIGKSFNEIIMDIFIERGEWYWQSWKANFKQSGGTLLNIGIHYFDLLQQLFGQPKFIKAYGNDHCYTGTIAFLGKDNETAVVSFRISLDAPHDNQKRVLIIDGKEINTIKYLDTLHTTAYQEIIKGNIIKIDDVLNTYNLINKLYESSKT